VGERSTRIVVALVAGGVLLAAFGWLDSSVMAPAHKDATRFFRWPAYSLLESVVYMAVAAAVLGTGLMARWARSLWVGIGYALAGAFFTFLNWLFVGPAGTTNSSPPLLPDPLIKVVVNAVDWSTGPVGATTIIGAGMLLVGSFTIARELRGRWLVRNPTAADL
jgi:hypothetical protein